MSSSAYQKISIGKGRRKRFIFSKFSTRMCNCTQIQWSVHLLTPFCLAPDLIAREGGSPKGIYVAIACTTTDQVMLCNEATREGTISIFISTPWQCSLKSLFDISKYVCLHFCHIMTASP